MHKSKMLSIALLFCFGGLAVYGQSSPLQLEIKLAQTVVQNNEDFSVSTVIRNTSSAEQSLQVLHCCYSAQWTADNPLVHVDCAESCMKNIPWKVTLKPGEAYKKTVLARVALAAGTGQPESVTFRMGFQSNSYKTEPVAPLPWGISATNGTTQTRQMIHDTPQIWSNAVMISVTR
jgi:hypothetical protein